MKDYSHINKMEDILNNHEKLLSDLNTVLDLIEKNKVNYDELMEYYYSDKRYEDLEDDNNNLIPKDLKRGVLSEDEIYNLITDYNSTGIRLLEVALKILKHDSL